MQHSLITTGRAAQIAGLTKPHIARQAAAGIIPCAIRLGNFWVFPEQAFREWAAIPRHRGRKSVAKD